MSLHELYLACEPGASYLLSFLPLPAPGAPSLTLLSLHSVTPVAVSRPMTDSWAHSEFPPRPATYGSPWNSLKLTGSLLQGQLAGLLWNFDLKTVNVRMRTPENLELTNPGVWWQLGCSRGKSLSRLAHSPMQMDPSQHWREPGHRSAVSKHCKAAPAAHCQPLELASSAPGGLRAGTIIPSLKSVPGPDGWGELGQGSRQSLCPREVNST